MRKLPYTRKAELEDIEELCAISQHPDVVPHQYRNPELRAAYEALIRSDDVASQNKLDVIEIDGNVVGFILHSYADVDEVRIALLGWSLHPTSWGRGIMTDALTQFLGTLFGEKDRTHVVAHCFSSNIRCIKLLRRMGFQRWRYPILSRVSTMVRKRSLEWEFKFGLTIEEWKTVTSNTTASE